MEKHINLIIDIGNTRIKTGLFEAGALVHVDYFSSIDKIRSEKLPDRVIISNVSNISLDHLPENLKKYDRIDFNHSTPLPIQVDYKTPNTLGLDRIAGAVGAFSEYYGQNCLVVDLGSCINYDILQSTGIFQGGIISPGFRMRMRAMHEFTGNLPNLELEWQKTELLNIGKSTKECMLKGAFEGILHEINSFIDHYKEEFGQLAVILTGGDASIFETNIKAPIFVRPNLVLIGLNRILEYNEA